MNRNENQNAPRQAQPCAVGVLCLVLFAAGCQSNPLSRTAAATSGDEMSAQTPTSRAAAPVPGPPDQAPKPAPVTAPTIAQAPVPQSPDPAVLARDFDAKLERFKELWRGAQRRFPLCPRMHEEWAAYGLSSAFEELKAAEGVLRASGTLAPVACAEGDVERCVVGQTAIYLNYLIRCGLDHPDNRTEASRLLSSLMTPEQTVSALMGAVSTLVSQGVDRVQIIAALNLAAAAMQDIPDLKERMEQLEDSDPDLAPHLKALIDATKAAGGDWLDVVGRMDRFMQRRALQFLSAAGRQHRPGDVEEPRLKVMVLAPGWSTASAPSIEPFTETIKDLLTTVIVDGVSLTQVQATNELDLVAALDQEAQRCSKPIGADSGCDAVFGVFVASPVGANSDRVPARAYLRFASTDPRTPPDRRAAVEASVSVQAGSDGDALRRTSAFTFAQAVAERIGVWGHMPLTDKRSTQGLLPSLHAGVSFSDRIEPKLATREQVQAVLGDRAVDVELAPTELADRLCDQLKSAGLLGRACVDASNPLTLEVTCVDVAAQPGASKVQRSATKPPPYCNAELLDGDTLIYTASVVGVHTGTRPSPELEQLVTDLGAVVAHLLLEFQRDPVRIQVTEVVAAPDSWRAMMFAGAPWLADDRSQGGDFLYTGGELALLIGGVASLVVGIGERKSSSRRANALMTLGTGALICVLPWRFLSARAYAGVRPSQLSTNEQEPP